MIDLKKDEVEVRVSRKGDIVWVNAPDCVLRICGIKRLELIDDREATSKDGEFPVCSILEEEILDMAKELGIDEKIVIEKIKSIVDKFRKHINDVIETSEWDNLLQVSLEEVMNKN